MSKKWKQSSKLIVTGTVICCFSIVISIGISLAIRQAGVLNFILIAPWAYGMFLIIKGYKIRKAKKQNQLTPDSDKDILWKRIKELEEENNKFKQV